MVGLLRTCHKTRTRHHENTAWSGRKANPRAAIGAY